MKKLKVCLSIATVCLAIAVLCFGVIAATQVTYTIGGSVSYVVTDAFVDIKTRVYTSQEKATSDTKLLAKSNYLTSATYIASALENDTLTEVEKYSDGRLDANTLKDQRDPAIYPDQTADTKINIDYSNSNYTWYIVVSITNLADNTVWANVSKQTFTGDFNSFANYTGGIDSIAKDETKSIVLGFSIKDQKTSIKDSTFDYSLTISADQDAKPELDTNPRVESLGKYYTPRKVSKNLGKGITNIQTEIETPVGNLDDAYKYIQDNNLEFSDLNSIPEELHGYSLLNINLPKSLTDYSLIYDIIVKVGNDKSSLAENASSSTNFLEEIKVIDRNLLSIKDIWDTDEYKNAQAIELNPTTIPEKSISDESKNEREMFITDFSNLKSSDITIVIKYSSIISILAIAYAKEGIAIELSMDLYSSKETPMITIGQETTSNLPSGEFSLGADLSYFFTVFDVPQGAVNVELTYNEPSYLNDDKETMYAYASIIAFKNDISSSIKEKYEKVSMLEENEVISQELYANGNRDSNSGIHDIKIYDLNDLQKFTLILDYGALTNSEILEYKFNKPFAFNIKAIFKDKEGNVVGSEISVPILERKAVYLEQSSKELTMSSQYYFAYTFDIPTDILKANITYDRSKSYGSTNFSTFTTYLIKGDATAEEIAKHDINSDGWIDENKININTKGDSNTALATISDVDLSGTTKATLIFLPSDSDILRDNLQDGFYANLTIELKNSEGVTVETKAIEKLELNWTKDCPAVAYGIALNYTIADEASNVDFQAVLDESYREAMVQSIEFMAILPGEWTFSSFYLAMMNEELSENDVLWMASGDCIQEDMSVIGSFNAPDGISKITLVAMAGLDKTTFEVGKKNNFPCDITFSYTGHDPSEEYIKVNYNENVEHLFVKKAYLEGSEDSYSFNKSGDYYYQNFQVKNCFDKYEEVNLYFEDMDGEYSILKGNRDSIGSDLTDIIATINSPNGVVTLTKDMGDEFCLVSSKDQTKMSIKPSLEKVTFDYELLRDDTLALTKYWDDGTTSLVIPDAIDGHMVSTIRSNTIYNNNTITELTVPDSIYRIEDESLYCPKLKTATMPYMAGIYQIDTWNDPTYINFPTLETLNLTKSGEFILNKGTTGFISGLDSLKTINFSDEVKDILIKHATDVTNLSAVSFSKNVQSFVLEFSYYYNPSDIPVIKNNTNNGLSILTARDNSTKVLVKALDSAPETITKEMLSGVKVIADSAFTNDNSVVKTIELPIGVEYIGNSALNTKYDSSLNVSLPSTIKELGAGALGNFTSPIADDNALRMIESYDNPEVKYLVSRDSSKIQSNITKDMLKGVRCIYGSTFYRDNGLKSIDIPETVMDIGDSAFSYTSLTSITLPSQLTKIKSSTFMYSTLSSIDIPNGVTTIESNAFESTDISNVRIPDSVISIGSKAFNVCSKLTDITLPNNLIDLSEDSFTGCNLSYISMKGKSRKYLVSNNCLINRYNNSIALACKNSTIPTDSEVAIINENAFNGLSITSVVIPNNITTIENYAFKDCKELVFVVIPDSVKKMGNNVFEGCTNLQSVVMSKNLSTIPYNTFLNCKKLTSVKLPEKLRTIGDYSFKNCTSLREIEIPDRTTTIEDGAFEGCESLEKVTLSKKMVRIGDDAFYGCKALKTIDLPTGLKKIEGGAFSNSGITEITLPNTLIEIGKSAFSKTNLTTITIPDSVTEVGTGAFTYCDKLTSFKLSKKMTSIPEDMFEYCSALENVTIPGNIKQVSGDAFNSCSNLTTVVFEEGIETINGCAFGRCSKLKSIQLPSTIKSIEGSSFEYCGAFETINFSGNDTFKLISGCLINTSTNALVVGTNNATIPTDTGITSIDSCAFHSRTITSANIPNTVTMIGSNAFENCRTLTNVIIPDSVITISYHAFGGCSALTSIVIPDSVKYMYFNVFSDCTNLESVKLSKNLTDISSSAFSGCENLKTIEIPNGVTSIGYYAFQNCKKLESVVFPDSLTTIDFNAFSGCEVLNNVTLPQCLIEIGSSAFENCKKLESIVLPDSLTTIGSYAFNGCTRLISIVIPKSITELNGTFDGCTNLESITLPEGLTSIGSRTFRNTRLTSIVIPVGVTEIGYEAFKSCWKLTEVTLSESLTTIGESAFMGCEISSIVIPKKVTSIGMGAFDIWDLKSATFEDPNGWKVVGQSLTLTDPAKNAEYLRSTYDSVTWTKS